MTRISMKTRVIALVVILTNLFGNFFLKWGLGRQPGRLGATALSYIAVLFDPWVALGVGLLIVWLLTRMALLSWADLSYVVPVTSIGYALNAVVAKAFLGEQMTAARWGGTLLIVAGTALVGSTSERTGGPGTGGPVNAQKTLGTESSIAGFPEVSSVGSGR